MLSILLIIAVVYGLNRLVKRGERKEAIQRPDAGYETLAMAGDPVATQMMEARDEARRRTAAEKGV